MAVADRWSVVLAVKALPTAKSRMVGLSTSERSDLALAMAEDVVVASLSSSVVESCTVVTSDERVRRALTSAGARAVMQTQDRGLNEAFTAAVHRLRSDAPAARCRGIALLMADLPFVTAEELERALAALTTRTAGVVADADGTGTTLLAAPCADLLSPQFGPGSFQRHLRGGAADLTPFAGQGLRRDVDLLPAIRAGAGPGPATRVWMGDFVPALGRL